MKRTIQIIILCLFIVNLANSYAVPENEYDYAGVFDRVIRSKFDIQTNRRLDLYGVNPYNVYKVVQEGNFIFLIGDENGVFMKAEGIHYYKAPSNPEFEECLRLVARMYQKDVEIPYTFPVVIQFQNCGGVAFYTGGGSQTKGIQEGKPSTWAGMIIDVDIKKNENVHYTLKEGESYRGLYLAEVIAHEIFHCVFWNEWQREYRVYPYSWVSDEHYEYEPGHYRDYSDDLGLVTHFYCGANAMLANAGKPIQIYTGHFSNAFSNTDDKFFAFSDRVHKAVNHLGKISLGIMKDVGFKLKPGVDIRCDKYTGYLFDETEQIWAHVSLGDTLKTVEKWFDNGEWFYTWKEYSSATSNETIKNDNHLDIRAGNGKILIWNNGKRSEIYIYSIWGTLIDRQDIGTGSTEIEIGSPGIYIVKSGNYSKKVLCL